MSRTIHKRRRNTKQTNPLSDRCDNSQVDVTQQQHWRKKQLTEKRHIKKQVRRERWRVAIDTPPLDLEDISIDVLTEGKFIHYPASVNDIVRVMHLLPMELLDGISSIELCLGAEYQEDFLYKEDFSYKPDPFTGRCSYEVLPGVFSGRCRGIYSRSKAKIRIFAYVYDSDLPNREMCELYLRLQMLITFVREVAHHHYFTAQLAQADGEDKGESYANRMEYEWAKQYVIPYLEQTYPETFCVLDAWIQHHGGVSASIVEEATPPLL